MKFTDGFWKIRPGVTALYAEEAYEFSERSGRGPDGSALRIDAPTRVILDRGDTLNRAVLAVTLSAPLPGIIRVRIEKNTGGARTAIGFELDGAVQGSGIVAVDGAAGTVTAGPLTARINRGAPWGLTFEADGKVITESGAKSIGHVSLAKDAPVSAEPAGVTGITETGLAASDEYLHARLSLGVGELVYGLGERFGPLVKNGQTIDIWNADGGTSSEQSYKNIPFYLTNKGYGILVNHPGHVSFEIGTESVEQVQFSVAGDTLEYLVIYGPTPKEILSRYTALTGRPAAVPAWSYGLWLSTSFTTKYDEATVNSFIDGMAERDLPLSVFHFDCFWMHEFNWTDFEWDARVFPDPEGMLERLHGRDLHTSAWINPYIAQRAPLFAEAKAAGFLVKRANGDVWQWDNWQAGMGLVDFTNPDAVTWFQGKIRRLLGQGIDAIKTDFGERIPLDVVWHDGSDPERMHNWYTQLYNAAVFEVLQEVRGDGEAVLFARSATVGGQKQPVHWGGDSSSSFASMAESLRGGLSLSFGGFGFWSHDIGGFEGMPDAAVFKRWLAFGLLSSHSRLHGSTSYRVPWLFDDGTEEPGESAVDVTRIFTKLKLELMPYLYQVGAEAHESGIPFMRPMQLEFPADPAVAYLDRQYMLGSDLLVAPVFSASGEVEYYLPAGFWTNYLTGETASGPCWRRETHPFDSVPLWVREGAVLATGNRADRPDYDYTEGVLVTVYPGGADERSITVANPLNGASMRITVNRGALGLSLESDSVRPFRARLSRGDSVESSQGRLTL